jgi:hypothetical protein
MGQRELAEGGHHCPVTQSCPAQLSTGSKKLVTKLSHARRVEIYRVLCVLDRCRLPFGPTIVREVRILSWRFSPITERL